MANNQYRLFQSSRVLTNGFLSVLVLGLFVLTASAMADIVERYNAGGTLTGSGTDVAAVQNAEGLAENDVIIISGTATHNTGIAQTIQNFTIRSSQAGVKQTIKAGNTRLYNFNDGVKTYNINLKDLDYQGYSSAVGNAIGLFMHTSPNLTLNINTDNVSFTGFKNAGYHGGVFGLDGAGNLNIVATNGLVFDGNRTNKTTGGAIHVNNGTLSIKADTLTFKNSYAATIGGAIYAGNKVTIEADSMTFESNSAGGGQGGAIYSKHDTLISGNTILFKSNSSTAHAGAIRLDNSSATLTIKGNSVTFDNNNGAGNEGGAICAHKLVMNGTSGSSVTTFKNNKTKNFGGAICAYTEATFKTGSFYFDNNSFSTRYTTNGYGGGAMTTNKLTISDVNVLSFTKNNSAYNGGAINLTASGVANIEAKTIIFEDNVANDHGGAIHGGSDAAVSITGESISFARNSNKTGDGGAIRMANSTVNVSGKNADTVITFSGNVSKGLGGAISARANLSNGAFTFENNSAGTYGGAIHGGIVAFSGDGTSAVFTGNTAVSGGNDLNVSTSLSFTDNGTYSFDGGIRLANDDTTMTIDKSQVTVSGRANDATNNYQLKNTTISNGGKLTANLDNINSFTGAFNLGYGYSPGTLELNLGAGLAKEISLSDVSFSGDGTFVKSGAGTVTFTDSNNSSFGAAKVSGGTLIVPSESALETYKVTVETGATFKTGADMISTEVVLDGGSFVVGDTTTSSTVTIGSLSLDNGGRICYDFNNAYGDYDADWLKVSSATLNSGYIDLTFSGSSADEWWTVIHGYDNGFSVIDGTIVDYDQFDPSSVKVTVNGMPTNSWILEAQYNQLVLYAVEGEDPQVDPWYDANTSDASLPNWTITGTDRVGAKFTDGGSDAEYSGEVNMNGNGSFDVSANKNLTLSNAISGDGAVTKIGEGTLTLAANNSYAGGTTISSGKLVLTGSGTLGTGGVVNNSVLEFAHDSTVTIGNVISGTGSVAMTGAGTVTLSGANSYSGGTTISAGTLKVTQVTGLGTGVVTINGGKLDASGAGSGQTFANSVVIGDNGGAITVAGSAYSSFSSISGSGDLTTNGYLHFNGTGGYNGHLTVNSGYTRINPGAFGIFDLTLNNSQFAVDQAGTIQIGKLNAPNGGAYLFGSNGNNQYVFEIGAGTTSSDTAAYGQAIRGSSNGAYNVTIKKVGEGAQTFNRTGYGYSGTPNSIKEVIVDGGKMVIDAVNDVFNGGNTTGYWGTAPITVNSGATLEYVRAFTTSPNVDMTVNGGTLTLDTVQYLNKLTLNSGTINGSGNLQVGHKGDGAWTVKGGTSTIYNNFAIVKTGDVNKTFTINFDSGSTLDVKKSMYGLANYTGANMVFNGTGANPGNIIIESGTMSALGDITFNNMNGAIAAPITGTSAVTKSGAGTVTLSGANTYTGATTVSGGTLVLASSGSLASNVTVGSGATFVDGASSITSNVTINGGTFTIGDTSATSRITIGDFALTSGTVNFDFNSASTADNYDFLTTGAATLTSGTINVTFNNGDVDTWWSNCSDSGYALISASSLTPGNIQLLVNSAQSQQWYLDTTGNTLVLKKQGSEPPTDKYYRANSQEALDEDTWTIDGTNKEGIKFIEGDKTTETYTGAVEMNAPAPNGTIEVADGKNLTLSGVVSGEGAMDKTGEGTLTLSGDNTYSGDTTVSEGKLTLSGAAVKANGPIEIAEDATLEYNVPTGEKSLEFTNSNAVTGSNAIKTGAGTLKILSTDGQFAPDNFAVEAGKLDFKGKYNGDLIVKTGSTLSPGNSVGDLTVYGNVTIDAGATGLFEFSAYNEDPTQQQFDTLTVNDGAFVIDENSIIKLYFEGGNDVELWAAKDSEYKLVSADNYNGATPILDENFTDLFRLDGIAGDGLYLIGLYEGPIPPGPEPGSGVPEPSTWALLVLGVAGLMYWRKRKNA